MAPVSLPEAIRYSEFPPPDAAMLMIGEPWWLFNILNDLLNMLEPSILPTSHS